MQLEWGTAGVVAMEIQQANKASASCSSRVKSYILEGKELKFSMTNLQSMKGIKC